MNVEPFSKGINQFPEGWPGPIGKPPLLRSGQPPQTLTPIFLKINTLSAKNKPEAQVKSFIEGHH
jgi:hypothetical protein